MNRYARIISTHSADVFGVCSALFELGGMTIMHDASGCNSTYTTHDEPRWYDMDSMVYISALSELEAIMGDDEKLISDIVTAARELRPRFIALAGTPIPAMTGFDYQAAAHMIESRTGIPALGIATTGMNTYVHGASLAFAALAERFVADTPRTADKTVNILGLTPLDFSVNGTDRSIAAFLEDRGWRVLSRWAMGDTLENIANSGGAHVNLVVSASGLEAAKILQKRFGTPFVVGVPYGDTYGNLLVQALETQTLPQIPEIPGSDIVILGEGVTSRSLALAIGLETGRAVRVLCTTECDASLLGPADRLCPTEPELEEALKGAKVVIGDPLFRPICPADAAFVDLPSESFSGRIYRENIPDLVQNFNDFIGRYLK